MPTYLDVSNTSIFTAAGLARAQWAKVDTNGIPMGPTGSIAQGADRGMGIYAFAKRAGGAASEPRITPVTGDNGRRRHQYAFNAADLGNLDLTFGAFNMDAYNAFSGTKTHAIGEWNAIGAETDAAVNASQVCLLFNVDAQEADLVGFGTARWVNWFYPLVTVTSLFATHEEVAAADWPFRGVPTQAGKYPWGVAFNTTDNGFTQAARTLLTSRNPLTMHTFVCDGNATSFTLDYTPASDQTGYVVRVYRYIPSTGAVSLITPTSISIASKTVQLASDYDAGDQIIVLYETFDIL